MLLDLLAYKARAAHSSEVRCSAYVHVWLEAVFLGHEFPGRKMGSRAQL